MSIVCGLDLETSGLDPRKDRITEVGAVLFDWNTATPLVIQSDLVFSGVALSQEIISLTGITEDLLETYGRNEQSVFQPLRTLILSADYVLAHFGNEFDQKFCRETFGRLNIEWPDKPWLDSSCDIVFPKEVTTRNLQYLAAEIGFLNPFRHRAVFDVLTMLRIASEHPLEKIVARSLEPMIYVQAIVTFQENQKAKDFNFRWNPEKKIWWKGQKQSDWEAERDAYQFKSSYMAGAPE